MIRHNYYRYRRLRDDSDKIETKVVYLPTSGAWLMPIIVENHTGGELDDEDWFGWASTAVDGTQADYILDEDIWKNAKEEDKSEDDYISEDLEGNGYVYFDRSSVGKPNIWINLLGATIEDMPRYFDRKGVKVVKADDFPAW